MMKLKDIIYKFKIRRLGFKIKIKGDHSCVYLGSKSIVAGEKFSDWKTMYFDIKTVLNR